MERTESPPQPPPPPPPPPHSPLLQPSPVTNREAFATNFTALYHSIFPPKPPPLSLSPSTSDSPTSSDDLAATDRRLHHARVVLEHQDLSDQYDLCLVRLHALSEELESLRLENAELRIENAELLDLLAISSSLNKRNDDVISSAPDVARLERRDPERVALPKSISVRSSCYVKSGAGSGSATPCSSATTTRSGVPSQLDQVTSDSGQHKVYVAGSEEAAMELEVYDQGMRKTELCNKWQEKGTCPYGENCQFAHGMTELLPVIRHPRYKTQACRMVLAGKICPYGHRCHFRHSLADHEQLMAPR